MLSSLALALLGLACLWALASIAGIVLRRELWP